MGEKGKGEGIPDHVALVQVLLEVKPREREAETHHVHPHPTSSHRHLTDLESEGFRNLLFGFGQRLMMWRKRAHMPTFWGLVHSMSLFPRCPFTGFPQRYHQGVYIY